MGFRCYRATDHQLSPVMSSKTTSRLPGLMWDDSKPAREACCWVETFGCLCHNRIHISSSYGICLGFRPAVWCVLPQDTKKHIQHRHVPRVLWTQLCHLVIVYKAWIDVCIWVAGLKRYQEFCAHWKYILNTHLLNMTIINFFPDFICKLLSDYNQANENCLLHISSTCWRDAVGETNPQSSNRAIWSLWFAFLGWLLTPFEDSGYSHERLQNLGVMCSSVKQKAEEGNLGCTATLCCRKRFLASGAAVENDDCAPPQ